MSGSRPSLRVWIDLDNTPHASFFRPVATELRERGHEVVVTARAHGRTVELAHLFGLQPREVGGWRGRSVPAKALATVWRAARLALFAARQRFDLAVSHGSRPMVLAARTLGFPVVTLYDYEGVSAGLFHRFSDRILVPAAVKPELPAGGRAEVIGYPGVKEELYLSSFRPGDGLRERLGVGPDEVLVVLRPEAETAHYHPRARQPLLGAVLDRLCEEPSVHVALVSRTAEQGRAVRALLEARDLAWSAPGPMDGLELIWASDLVIGGGGTMTREAAVMGVPAYSIFQGRDGAVDRALEDRGRLRLIRRPSDAAHIRLERRTAVPAPGDDSGRDLLRFVVDQICAAARPGTEGAPAPTA